MLCIHKFSESLYKKLYNECQLYIFEKVDSLQSYVHDKNIFLEQMDIVSDIIYI